MGAARRACRCACVPRTCCSRKCAGHRIVGADVCDSEPRILRLSASPISRLGQRLATQSPVRSRPGFSTPVISICHGRSPDDAKITTVEANTSDVLTTPKSRWIAEGDSRPLNSKVVPVRRCAGVVTDAVFRPGRPVFELFECGSFRSAPFGVERYRPRSRSVPEPASTSGNCLAPRRYSRRGFFETPRTNFAAARIAWARWSGHSPRANQARSRMRPVTASHSSGCFPATRNTI